MPPTKTLKPQNQQTYKTPDIKLNDKILDALAVINSLETRVFTMEGSITV